MIASDTLIDGIIKITALNLNLSAFSTIDVILVGTFGAETVYLSKTIINSDLVLLIFPVRQCILYIVNAATKVLNASVGLLESKNQEVMVTNLPKDTN